MGKITFAATGSAPRPWDNALRILVLALVNTCTAIGSFTPAALGSPLPSCPSESGSGPAGSRASRAPQPGKACISSDETAAAPAPALSPAAQAQSLSDADAAFRSGAHDRALELYQSVLAGDPDNIAALRRAGLLLGWAGHPDDATGLLERAVHLDPAHRPTRAQLARVESWDGKFDKSLEQYDRLLREEPSDRSIATERARVLSWAGRLAASEDAYRAVLATDPDNMEATLGLAQCLGWQGRLDESASLYKAVLPKDPMNARIGLGRVSLWRGDTEEALRAAHTALLVDPNNKEALELRKDALRRTRPSLTAASELSADTDDNRNVMTGLTGSFHPSGAVDLDVTLTHMNERGHDLAADRFAGLDLTGDGTVDVSNADEIRELSTTVVGATAGFRAGSHGRMTIGAAAERLGEFDRSELLGQRSEQTELSGSISYKWNGSPVSVRAGFMSDVPKWTAYITQNDLRWNHAELGLEGGGLPFKARWSASVDAGRITGGAMDNGKQMAAARTWREIDLGHVTLTPHASLRYLSYQHNLLDGYFDPQSYDSGMLGADLGGALAGRKLTWGFSADAGIERFRFDAEETDVCDFLDAAPGHAQCVGLLQDASRSGNNTTVALSGRLSWAVRENLSLDATASWNDSAAQTASGFESHTFGLAARIGF